MPDDADIGPKTQIAPNLRLIFIIEEIARAGAPVTASALSEALGLPTATIHRLLATAEEEGLVQRDLDGRSYAVGRRMRRLSGNILSSQRIRTERLLVMRALAETVGETCNLAAPMRHGMVYLDRVETHWPLRIQLAVGTQVPFHATASGKMYLSSLRSDKLNRTLKWLELTHHTDRTLTDAEPLRDALAITRQRGYATDDEEFMEGMSAIAVPIRGSQGRLLSTLSIHAPVQRHDVASLVGRLADLQSAAKQIEDLCME